MYTAALTFGGPAKFDEHCEQPPRARPPPAVRTRSHRVSQSVPLGLTTYTLHLNHTTLPPTRRLFSDVSVGVVKVAFGPDTDWRKAYLLANLQLAVDRSLLALQLQAQGGAAREAAAARARADGNAAGRRLQTQTAAAPQQDRVGDAAAAAGAMPEVLVKVRSQAQSIVNAALAILSLRQCASVVRTCVCTRTCHAMPNECCTHCKTS